MLALRCAVWRGRSYTLHKRSLGQDDLRLDNQYSSGSYKSSRHKHETFIMPETKHSTNHATSDDNMSSSEDTAFVTPHVESEDVSPPTESDDVQASELKMRERLNMSHSKVRNLGKKLKRRDEMLTELGEKLQEGEEERETLEQQLSDAMETVGHLQRKLNNASCSVAYQKSKSVSLSSSICDLNAELAKPLDKERELELTVENLTSQLELERSLVAVQHLITPKVNGQYTAEARQCCYELLAKNVGVWNVGPIMRSVVALAGAEISEVPSAAALSQMLVELRQISQLHVANALVDDEFTTGHSNGTSKHGVSYQSYQMTTDEKVYSIGMAEVKSGTSQHVFDMFKQVLDDTDSVATEAGHVNVAKKIVAHMKNSMSDRCAVQKKYNCLVEEYRKEILPEVIEG